VPIQEVQRKAGTFVGNGGTTTALDAATTASNTVVILVGHSNTITTPTGFTRTGPTSATGISVFHKLGKDQAGGESTYTFPAPGSSRIYSYLVLELEGVDPDYAVDVAPGSFPGGAANSLVSSTTAYDGLVIGAWGSTVAGSTVPTFSGHTGGFDEIDDHGATDATNAVGLSVAWRFTQTLATWSSTATASAGTVQSAMVALAATGSKRQPRVDFFWAFPAETAAYPASHSISPSSTGYRLWETSTGAPTIDSDGLRLQATSSIQNIQGRNLLTTSPRAGLERVRFRINSAGGDLELCTLKSLSGSQVDNAVLRYVAASGKLGLKLGSGAEVLSDQTVAVDGSQWVDVDLRVNGETTAFTADWRVNYGSGWVDQAQATLTATAVFGGYVPILGWVAASTGNVSYAYAAYSLVAAHYPLGDYAVVFLGPDSGASPTVLGTSTNFRRFTANTTIDGAYNAAAIMAAIDDWPPVFGASADGLAVVTADAAGIRIPLATYDAPANGASVRAMRAVVAFWAAAATAATIGVIGYDGSGTNTTLFTEADPNADTSSTPPWIIPMWWPQGNQTIWDQAKVDAAAIEIRSSDATPDIGVHALGAILLVRLGESVPVFGGGDPLRVEQVTDPDTGGIVQLHAYTPADQSATLVYELSGVEQTPVVVAAGSDPQVVVVGAPDLPTVSRIELQPDEPS
jgi:hypothetical protein